MRLFIDTANVDEIREMNDLGVISGVTTNPSLIAREGRDFKEVVKEIVSIVDGPISAEVVSMEAGGMIKEAEDLSTIHPNIVIKIPMTGEGLKAVKHCTAKGISTNVTLVFSANQALMAALAGANYVSPFVGRLDDIGVDGVEVVDEIIQIFNTHALDTEVISASIRNPMHVTRSAQVGADIATVPTKVLRQLLKHPLTDIGIQKFLDDWKNAGIK